MYDLNEIPTQDTTTFNRRYHSHKQRYEGAREEQGFITYWNTESTFE